MLRTTTDREARALLRKTSVGRLGCVVAGEPYVVPINYYFDGSAIYSHSLPGRKMDALRAHPRACIQVDKIDDQLHWQSAIAFGNFEEIVDESERAEVMRALLERFPMLTVVEAKAANPGKSPDPLVFRIRSTGSPVFRKFRAEASVQEEAFMKDGIDRSAWVAYLTDFTKRNLSRPTQLEVFGENGAQKEQGGLLFAGISVDGARGRLNIEIMFGKGEKDHLTHIILDVRDVTPKRALDGRDEALAVIDGNGETSLLRFEST